MSTITSQQDAEQENSDQIASEYVRVLTCWSTQDKFRSTAIRRIDIKEAYTGREIRANDFLKRE